MEDEKSEGQAHTLRAAVPGYFPPSEGELEEFFTSGLIAFDTNALFDAYRFSPPAREDFFSALEKLEDRLWVSHRVAEEFMRNRLGVIAEGEQALGKALSALAKNHQASVQVLHSLANRQRLDEGSIKKMVAALDKVHGQISVGLEGHAVLDIDLDSALRDDPILRRIEEVLDGNVGIRLDDEQKAHAEGVRRIKAKIPPGYADADKDESKAVGDFFVWAQLKIEAVKRMRPVLLVSNDQKEDWILRDRGRTIGPRPELVEEMRQDAGVRFHMLTVSSFLIHAQTFLSAAVSEDTFDQAERLSELATLADQEGDTSTRPTGENYEKLVLANLQIAFPDADITKIQDDASPVDASLRVHSVRLANDSRRHSVNIDIIVKYCPGIEGFNSTYLKYLRSILNGRWLSPVLIIANCELPAVINRREREFREVGATVKFVNWVTLSDNEQLRQAVNVLLDRWMESGNDDSS
ncbi:hypothetical protein K8Z49_43090 [Actinomadura madurae]|uniref:PIN-like domain-containing protein n=1 Tax=Actinomadura madurae TaxID=1993 RepID=UPI003999D158